MLLDWAGCDNARDLGGLPTADNGRIRRGALLRSGHHADLTDIDLVRSAGISRVLDLRTVRELASRPSPFAGQPAYAHAPVPVDELTHELDDSTYAPLIDRNRKQVAAAFRALAAAPPGAVLVHCTYGRDRTGTLVALALAVAGVAPQVIADDYARSEGAPAARMLATLRHLDDAYGGAVAYLLSIGISRREVDAVRERLRAPDDRPATAEKVPQAYVMARAPTR